MPDKPLRLTSDEGGDGGDGGGDGLTSGRLVRRLAEHKHPIVVTDQTIRNWRQAGMPTCGQITRGTVLVALYDEDDCRTWIAKNRRTKLHGGKRRRAGRKRKDKDMSPKLDMSAGEKKAEARELFRELADAAEEGNAPISIENGLLGLSESQLNVLARIPEEISGLDHNAMSRLRLLTQTTKDQLDINKQSGLLLDVSDVRREITRALTIARTNADGMAGRLTPAIINRFALSPEDEPVLRDMIEREMVRLCGALAGMGEGKK